MEKKKAKVGIGFFLNERDPYDANILYNPEGLLKGSSVRVYTDRVNYKNYYVDIDEVLVNVKFH